VILPRRRHSRPMSRAFAAGQTRTFGGFDGIFQLRELAVCGQAQRRFA
jgi:hypothetical protein